MPSISLITSIDLASGPMDAIYEEIASHLTIDAQINRTSAHIAS